MEVILNSIKYVKEILNFLPVLILVMDKMIRCIPKHLDTMMT